jgi:outer membrane protein TolC
MRWKKKIGALALLLASITGCKQTYFITESERDYYAKILPPALEMSGQSVPDPLLEISGEPPTTVNDPERPIRYLSLAEAISIALEQGRTGNLVLPSGSAGINPFLPSPAIEDLAVFSGQGITGNISDAIRVLQLDPGIIGAGIEASLAKFDTVWTSSATWNTTNRPIGTSLDVFQAGNTGVNVINQEQATVSTALIKPLPTGGVAGITFNNNYTLTNLPARVNPAYQPSLQFSFEQPLLQGYGVEINQIRAAHPGSILNPGVLQGQTAPEGILITRLRTDQQRAEFERNVNNMLANVEFTYWGLYSAYWDLYARESGLRMAYEAWRVFKVQLQFGTTTSADEAQARGQYHLFRSQRLDALQNVLESERELRYLLGLRVEDRTRLVPTDKPTLAPYQPNWETALHEALTLRPELYMVRQELKAEQLNLIAAKNLLLPDVRFTATYDFNSIGSRLDGPDPTNAWRNLAKGDFHDWTVGIRANIPIGYRAQEANVRIAKLRLARTFQILIQQEARAETSLKIQYSRVQYAYDQIRAFRDQRIAYGDQLRSLVELVLGGKKTPDILLEAQRFYADALVGEYNAIRDYNVAIAAFEFAKGTIMQHDSVSISEGCLPTCAFKRAVAHQEERTKACVLRERANPVECASLAPQAGLSPVAKVPTDEAPALPALIKANEQLPPMSDHLSVFNNHDKEHPMKPVDVSKIPEISGAKTQPPAPGVATTGAATPAVKKPVDFGTLRPADGPPATKPVDAPKAPAALPPAPVPVDPSAMKID